MSIINYIAANLNKSVVFLVVYFEFFLRNNKVDKLYYTLKER